MQIVAAGADLVEAPRVLAAVFAGAILYRVQAEGADLVSLDQPGIGAVVATDHSGGPLAELAWHRRYSVIDGARPHGRPR